MLYFHELLKLYAECTQEIWNFIELGEIARSMFLQDGKLQEHATVTAFFSIFNNGKVELIHLSINEDRIEYETINVMHAHFSMFAGTPNDPIYQQFTDALRPINAFNSFQELLIYHIDLIKSFYKRQQSFDESITSSFDLFIQSTKTGHGFIQTINNQ